MEINILKKIIEKKLRENFTLTSLEIEDKSFLHKKHKNFKEDKFHIKLTIGADEFKNVNSIDSNRKIYDVLRNEMKENIHSLQIIIT